MHDELTAHISQCCRSKGNAAINYSVKRWVVLATINKCIEIYTDGEQS